MQFDLLDRPAHGAGVLVIGGAARRANAAGLSAKAKAPPAASITAGAVLPAAAAAAATPAQLPPLAGLARDVQQAVVLAAAAARSTVLVSRGTAVPLRRRSRPKPTSKSASSSAESGSTAAALVPPAAPTAAVPTAAAATAAPAAVAAGVQQQRALRQFVSGGLAGAVAKTLVAPMERVSTLLMTDAQRRFSLAAAVQHAWRDGLYRGHAATLVKIFPASAIQFAVFNTLKDRLLAGKQRVAAAAAAAHASSSSSSSSSSSGAQSLGVAPVVDLANHERLMAGAAAGAAAASVCYPLEALRTQMGVAGGLRGNLLQAARSVVASHGMGALYKGFRASLIGDVLGNALGFTAYEIGNRIYRDLNGGRAPPPAHRGLIGTCSAAVVLTLTLPLEVVRRRLQVQGLAGRPVLYRGTLDCIRQVLRTDGIKGFYAASLPSYLKVAPSIGCMYFLFEVFMAHSARLPPLNLRLPQPVQQAAPEAAAPAVASS